MALPPDLPPYGNAIQRIRRIQRLKHDAEILTAERQTVRRRLRRQLRWAPLHGLVVFATAYFVVDTAFGLLLGTLEPHTVWIFAGLLPMLGSLIKLGLAVVDVATLTHRRIRIAIDLSGITRPRSTG